MCCMVCCIQIVLSCLPRKPPQSSLHPLSVSHMIVSGVMMMECGLVTDSVSPHQYSDPDQRHSPPVSAMCTHVITGHWTLLYTATVSSPWISTLSTNVPGGDMTMQCQYHIQYPDQVVLLQQPVPDKTGHHSLLLTDNSPQCLLMQHSQW